MTEAISKKLDNVLKAIEVLTERMNTYEDGGKLDNILKSIEGLNQRMDIFDNKIEAINLRVTDLENNIQIRFQTVENSVKESASNMEIKMLKDRIKKIEGILEKTAKDSDLDEAFQRLFLLGTLKKNVQCKP